MYIHSLCSEWDFYACVFFIYDNTSVYVTHTHIFTSQYHGRLALRPACISIFYKIASY